MNKSHAAAQLELLVKARGSRLMDLHSGPRRPDVGRRRRHRPVRRRRRFASWTGAARLDASSVEEDPAPALAGRDRRMNHVIHIAAISQMPPDAQAEAYSGASWPPAKPSLRRCAASSAGSPTRFYREFLADATVGSVRRRPDSAGTVREGAAASSSISAESTYPHVDTR